MVNIHNKNNEIIEGQIEAYILSGQKDAGIRSYLAN